MWRNACDSARMHTDDAALAGFMGLGAKKNAKLESAVEPGCRAELQQPNDVIPRSSAGYHTSL